MSTPSTSPADDPADDPTAASTGTPYDVAVLLEEDLSAGDAERITSLHAELASQGQQVRYHLLVPVDEASARVHSAMGSFAAGEPLPAPVPGEVEQVEQAVHDAAATHLETSVAAMRSAGARHGMQVGGETVVDHPVDALRRVVTDVGAREAIVVTTRHVVAEFARVDWASRAQRHLGIPVLHLVEHESFAEQAGDPGGITGL